MGLQPTAVSQQTASEVAKNFGPAWTVDHLLPKILEHYNSESGFVMRVTVLQLALRLRTTLCSWTCSFLRTCMQLAICIPARAQFFLPTTITRRRLGALCAIGHLGKPLIVFSIEAVPSQREGGRGH